MFHALHASAQADKCLCSLHSIKDMEFMHDNSKAKQRLQLIMKEKINLSFSRYHNYFLMF